MATCSDNGGKLTLNIGRLDRFSSSVATVPIGSYNVDINSSSNYIASFPMYSYDFNNNIIGQCATVAVKFRKAVDTPKLPSCTSRSIISSQGTSLVAKTKCAPSTNGSIELYVDIISNPTFLDPLQQIPSISNFALFPTFDVFPRKNRFYLCEHPSNLISNFSNFYPGILGTQGYLSRSLPLVIDPTSPLGQSLGDIGPFGQPIGIQYNELLWSRVSLDYPLYPSQPGPHSLPFPFAGVAMFDQPLTHDWNIVDSTTLGGWQPPGYILTPPNINPTGPLGTPTNTPHSIFFPFVHAEIYPTPRDHFGVPRALTLTPGRVYRFGIVVTNPLYLMGAMRIEWPDYVFIDLVCGPCE